MNRWEYTYLWWEGSATSTNSGQVGHTTPPIDMWHAIGRHPHRRLDDSA